MIRRLFARVRHLSQRVDQLANLDIPTCCDTHAVVRAAEDVLTKAQEQQR